MGRDNITVKQDPSRITSYPVKGIVFKQYFDRVASGSESEAQNQ